MKEQVAPALSKILTYCDENSIPVAVRTFNPRKYSDDCVFIEKLPSIHIYKGSAYTNTVDVEQGIHTLETMHAKQQEKYRQARKRIFWWL
jgi:hypothetical protein